MVSGWNTGAERTFGYSERQILGQPAARFFTPEDVANGEAEKDLRRAVENGRTEDERWMVRQNGTRFWARWVTTPMRDNTGALRGFAKVLRDETERKAAADLLETSLKEKEILLREIHHRVKNNLHVITALVSLQSAKVSDPAVQAVFKELQDRVWAIAALHETLYASPNLSSILFGPYMEQLMRDLLRFHDIGTKQIEVNAESDDVVLSIEQALPLGLILTELASNAFKHAFPHLSNGTIKVALRYLPKTDSDFSLCELAVQDTGLGVPNPGDLLESNSMGLQIVQLLTKQLNGTLHVDQNAGTRICVRFPLKAEPDVAASI
jgi:PAS domain S-box-containing protein